MLQSLAQLSAACQREVDEAVAVTWIRALRDVGDEDLAEAIDQWVRHSSQFPRPAEIIQTAQIIVRRRRMQTRALPEPELPEGQLLDMRREGLKSVRKALAEATSRGGVVKHIDDVLSEDGGSDGSDGTEAL